MHVWRALCGLLWLGFMCPSMAVPQRVLSLDLCTDWLLAWHAPRTQVVALSPLHQQQYPVEWLGAAWPTHDGSLEHILQLAPDLVLAGEYNAPLLQRRLRQLGVRVETLPLPRTLQQMYAYEQRVLSLLGLPVERASPIPTMREVSAERPRLLLLGANGIGTGQNTLENQLIQQAGWRNYLPESGYISLNLEDIVAHPPDAILWAAPQRPALANRFAEHPVLRRAVPAERWLRSEYWRWQCPGPWTWELIKQLQP